MSSVVSQTVCAQRLMEDRFLQQAEETKITAQLNEQHLAATESVVVAVPEDNTPMLSAEEEALYEELEEFEDLQASAADCDPPDTPLSTASTASSSSSEDETSAVVEVTKSSSLVIFDWDDTLFPTSWLGRQQVDMQGNAPPAVRQKLQELESAVSKTLECAVGLSDNVVVVTNAETGWVEMSARLFMPGLTQFLTVGGGCVRVVSARSMHAAEIPDQPEEWKNRAFDEEISAHLKAWKGCGRRGVRASEVCNVASFGDSNYEREALLRASRSHPALAATRHVAKSIKFLCRPDCHQLKKQHTLIHECLPQLIGMSNNLDMCVQWQD